MLIRAALVLPAGSFERLSVLLPGDVAPFAFRPGRDALADAARSSCDLVVCARSVLGRDAARTVRRLRAGGDPVDVVAIVPEEDPVERAVLLGAGCLAVLCERVDDAALADALRSLIGRHRDTMVAHAARPAETGLAALASREPAVQKVLEAARRVAATDAPVLLLGETGVGKERLARALHAESRRAAGPFVPISGATLPEALAESELFGHEAAAFTGAERARRGLFEMAHGGTLFLDEVGELPFAVQAKLLRALQDGEIRPIGSERSIRVDVRVIAATNHDLSGDVAAGRFRADLFYRLNVVALELPPLRARRVDVPELVESQIELSARRLGRPAPAIAPDAMEALTRHAWPGNVRELVHVVERAVLLCDGDTIRVVDLGIGPPQAGSGDRVDAELLEAPWHEARARAIATFERCYVDHALRQSGGRVGAAAQRAGISERAMFAAMRRLGLRKEDYRGRR